MEVSTETEKRTGLPNIAKIGIFAACWMATAVLFYAGVRTIVANRMSEYAKLEELTKLKSDLDALRRLTVPSKPLKPSKKNSEFAWPWQ